MDRDDTYFGNWKDEGIEFVELSPPHGVVSEREALAAFQDDWRRASSLPSFGSPKIVSVTFGRLTDYSVAVTDLEGRVLEYPLAHNTLVWVVTCTGRLVVEASRGPGLTDAVIHYVVDAGTGRVRFADPEYLDEA